MNILGIDTSGPLCSVAITTAMTHYAQSNEQSNQHTNVILTMINNLLAQTELSWSELDLVSWCYGPGSFTGLRIGASVVQSIAYMGHVYVANVSTLRVLAHNAYQHYKVPYVASAIDARKGEVYWGLYQLNHDGIMDNLNQEKLTSPSDVVLTDDYQWLAAGSGWAYIDDMVAINQKRLQRIDSQLQPKASVITRLDKNQYEPGQVVSAFEAIPNYLRQQVG